MERFWEKVNKSERCWEWTAGKNRGYGQFFLDGKEHKAHRVSYTLEVGPIPEGFDVHHKCENRGCVRPLHLNLIEHGKHSIKHNTGNFKSRCVNGHARTPENVYSGGHCKICKRAWEREYRAKRKLNDQ